MSDDKTADTITDIDIQRAFVRNQIGRELYDAANNAMLPDRDRRAAKVQIAAAINAATWECPDNCGSTSGPHTHGGPSTDTTTPTAKGRR